MATQGSYGTSKRQKNHQCQRSHMGSNCFLLIILLCIIMLKTKITVTKIYHMPIEERKFHRKVPEALEIQLQNTSPHSKNGLNQDNGQYMTTRFWKINVLVPLWKDNTLTSDCWHHPLTSISNLLSSNYILIL